MYPRKSRYLSAVLVFAMIFTLIAGFSVPSSVSAAALIETKDGVVLVEAESLTLSGQTGLKEPDSSESGGKAVNFPFNTDNPPASTDAGDLEFSFKADQAGGYTVWLLVKPSTPNKSLWITKQDGTYGTIFIKGTANTYEWLKTYTYTNIAAGSTVDVKLKPRQGYFVIDKVYVVMEGKGTPADFTGTLSGGTPATTPETTPTATPTATSGQSAVENVVYPTPPVLPPANTHPRVMFTKDDIPKILENAQKSENLTNWQAFEKYLAAPVDGKLPALNDIQKTNYNDLKLVAIESHAFDYAIRGNEASGKIAVSALRDYLNTLVIDYGPGSFYNQTGHVMGIIGEVYDWCYPLLTDADKKLFYDKVIEYTKPKTGYPKLISSVVTSHGVEGPVFHDLLLPGIAMYDEYPDIYLNAAGKIFSEIVEAKKILNKGHSNLNGTMYTKYRSPWEFYCVYLFDAIGYKDIFGPEQQRSLDWLLYARRPDGELIRDGDSTASMPPATGIYRDNRRSMMFAASLYKDQALKGEFLRQSIGFPVEAPAFNQSISPVEYLIVNDPSVPGRPFTDLPLSKYFPSPKGGFIARTGWDMGLEAPTMVVEAKVNELWIGSHQHKDNGAFQIYYKGLMAIDTGYYKVDALSDYGVDHWKNWHIRTVAHNSMLIFDPSEEPRAGGYINDGGQRFPNTGREANSYEAVAAPDSDYHISKVLGHEFGLDPMTPNYTYLKGDLTKAYSNKIKDFERSFMFFDLKNNTNPGALIVFDRVVSSNPSFKKSWLVHGLQEPERNGNQTVFRNNIQNYNGKMTVDTLLPKPENTNIEVIGGPGKEFWVNGANVNVYATPSTPAESSGYRIEVSPKAPSETDYFLNVIQVGDSTPDTPALPVTMIETDKVAGAVVADRVAVFGKDKNRTKSDVEFSFANSGDFEITVADLQAGTWDIYKDGTLVGETIATVEGGVGVFSGKAGSYKLTYKNDNAARPPVQSSYVPPSDDVVLLRIDKVYPYTDVKPFVKDGRTLLPMRAIFEKLTAEVTWDEATRSATAVRDDITIKITEDSTTAYVNGEAKTLDVPATIVDGRFVVPVRFVSESMGAVVTWCPEAKVVDIDSNIPMPIPPAPEGFITVKKVTASGYDDESVPGLSLDGINTTYWANLGKEGKWIMYDFGSVVPISAVHVMWHNNHQRQQLFKVEISQDGDNWTTVFDGMGTNAVRFTFEEINLPAGSQARYVRITGFGTTIGEHNTINEVQFKQ